MNKYFNKDFISVWVRRAVDVLFLQNSVGTSMGVLFGFVADMLVKIFDPVLAKSQVVVFSKINLYYYILSGVFIFNLPSLFRRQKLDPKIEEGFAVIKYTKKQGNIPDYIVRQMYIKLCEQVLESVTLDAATSSKLRRAKAKTPKV